MRFAGWLGLSSLLPALFSAVPSLADSNAAALSDAGLGGGPKAPGLHIAGEFTYTISPLFEICGSQDSTLLKYEDGRQGSLDFYGVSVRFRHPALYGIQLDTKIGASRKTANDDSSGLAAGFGFGAGYRIPIGERLALTPRIGWRFLPDGPSTPEASPAPGMTEVGVAFSIVI